MACKTLHNQAPTFIPCPTLACSALTTQAFLTAHSSSYHRTFVYATPTLGAFLSFLLYLVNSYSPFRTQF